MSFLGLSTDVIEPKVAGHRRHPPPPTSPPIQRPTGRISPSAKQEPTQHLTGAEKHVPREIEKRTRSSHGRTRHPDEFNRLEEAERHSVESRSPEPLASTFADVKEGDHRRDPSSKEPPKRISSKRTDRGERWSTPPEPPRSSQGRTRQPDESNRPDEAARRRVESRSSEALPGRFEDTKEMDHGRAPSEKEPQKRISSKGTDRDAERQSHRTPKPPTDETITKTTNREEPRPSSRHINGRPTEMVRSAKRPTSCSLANEDRVEETKRRSTEPRLEVKTNVHEKPTETKKRHPPPPQSSHGRKGSILNEAGEKSRSHVDRNVNAEDPDYVNLTGLNASLHEGLEASDRSNEPSSYDPRVVALSKAKALRKHSDMKQTGQPAVPVPENKPISRTPAQYPARDSFKRNDQRSPLKAENRYSEDDDDDDDLGDSDEELVAPALRRIPQTRKSAESLVQAKHPTPGSASLRHPSKEHVAKHSSVEKGQPRYRPEQFHPHQYDQPYRLSRTRTKHDTATTERHETNGSRYSVVISTKRRTLSGLTGQNPTHARSSSMNALWFGDHPVPSPGLTSPILPLRLSNIQLQAQAELERRHRSTSSRTHSLDRRSGYSTATSGSRLSQAASKADGLEGGGYGYDLHGRLIHGGASLNEIAASRRRRLRDGHESLSRVWIPQTERSSNKQSADLASSEIGGRSNRKTNVDESAMAFALHDFIAPPVG